LKLVGSIKPTDILLERVSSQGPKLLKLYIDFAINGIHVILDKASETNGVKIDSLFEDSVYEFLSNNGYDVVKNIGCSDYRLDMAVRNPNRSGQYAIGIECDGSMYNSARTARERDRLRQTILGEMGWIIYRVWSTDWIKDQHTEGARLLDAVKKAINGYSEVSLASNAPTAVKTMDFLDMSTQTVYESIQEGVQQKFNVLRSNYFGWQADDIPTKDFAETMCKVLKNDFGLDKAGLFKETALYGYGWRRQGINIKTNFESVLDDLLKREIVKEEADNKIKLKDFQNDVTNTQNIKSESVPEENIFPKISRLNEKIILSENIKTLNNARELLVRHHSIKPMFREDIKDLISALDSYKHSSEIAAEVIEKLFPAPQMAHDKFMGELSDSDTAFLRLMCKGADIISIAVGRSAKGDEFLEKIKEDARLLVEICGDLATVLINKYGDSGNYDETTKEIGVLLADLQVLIESVKNYS
jgi:very-short-patch-repair endonuclease